MEHVFEIDTDVHESRFCSFQTFEVITKKKTVA